MEGPNLFRDLIGGLGDHVAIFDSQWRYIYVNEAAVRLLGKPASELIGKCIWDLFPGQVGSQFYNELHLVASERACIRSEHYHAAQDQWFENQILCLGKCVAVVSQDITGKRRIQKKLEQEQQRLREVLDSISDAFVAISADGRITYMNTLALRITGKGIGDVLNRSFKEVFPMFFGTDFEHAANEAVARNVPVRVQAIGPITKRWFESMIYPNSGGISVYSRDIHEQKLAEEALRESEERLRLAMEAGELGTWDWDLTSDKVTWSEKTRELHGMAPGEFDGTMEAFTALVHPEDSPLVHQAIRQSLAGMEKSHQLEFRIVQPNGRIRWVTTSCKVHFDKNGKPLRMVGASADISDRKRAEFELRHARDSLAEQARMLEHEVFKRTAKLTQMVQSLEGVAYTIAHDLRAPLRALNGFAEIVRDDYGKLLDESGRRYLASIADSAAQMDTLISDLHDYASLSHSDWPAEPVSLEEEIRKAMEDLHDEIDARNAEISVARPLGTVMANPTVVHRVLVNLLSNAIRFVATGTTPRVQIESERRGGTMHLYIRDNGIGIPFEFHQRIFGLFQRLHKAPEYPGTGIGLAIVKKGLERMGGTVGLASETGQGSTFWIELPAAP